MPQGELLAFDASLVSVDVLANHFLPPSIVPMPIDGSEQQAGYGVRETLINVPAIEGEARQCKQRQ